MHKRISFLQKRVLRKTYLFFLQTSEPFNSEQNPSPRHRENLSFPLVFVYYWHRRNLSILTQTRAQYIEKTWDPLRFLNYCIGGGLKFMKSCKKHLKLLQILPWENMILESCFKGFRSITFMNAANSGHMVYVLAEACFWIAFLKKLAKKILSCWEI